MLFIVALHGKEEAMSELTSNQQARIESDSMGEIEVPANVY